ncbi:MAG: GDSL-type esterase/lipase family protein [Polyangiaceae bacterium]
MPRPPTAPAPAPVTARSAELAHFYDALSALGRHERRDSVRILWLGDSHTAADFWTGAVRSALRERYGAGGPGFLRLGVQARHDDASLARGGRFALEPHPPARRAPEGDGVFGLGGMRVTALAPGAHMTVKLAAGALRGRARYTLLFDFKRPGEFQVRLGSSKSRLRSASAAERVASSPILRRSFEGEPSDAFEIEVTRGEPRFYGVVVEGTEPGVVLDAVGIDGARIATTLAWAEPPFVAEVAARKPDLVVAAFGTNEAFDELRPSAYAEQLTALMSRLRRANKPDCLVMGPPDANAENGESARRVAEISAVYAATARSLGCAFVSAQALMGGAGGFSEWLHREPQLARPDRIHLTPKGYRRLGELTFASLLGEGAAAAASLDSSR